MNSFKDIWNNPEERPDFIIALIVCALFGVGILYFLPQSEHFLTTTGESSAIAAKATTGYVSSPATIEVQEQNTLYTRKILTDKDVEEGRIGSASNTKRPSHISKPSSNQIGIDNDTNPGSGSTNTPSDENEAQNQNVNNSNEDNTNIDKTLQLDSLKTTDFQETEIVDELGKDKPSDLDSLANKNSDESLTNEIDKDLKTEDNTNNSEKNTAKAITDPNKDTNSDESSKNQSNKNITDSDNNTTTTPVTPSKTKTPKTTPKSDDFNRHIGECIIVVGAFEKDHNARKIIRKLKGKGYTVKTGWRKGLKYVGVPTNCKDKNAMKAALQKLRKTFDIEAWVLRP
ncbi:MAG: SPOR domain-containing protein [Chitinophagales bacterium]